MLRTECAPRIPQTPAQKTGRHWGVFNRKKLPFAEMTSSVCLSGEWIKKAKILAAEVYPPIADCEYDGGFTLFTEEAEEYRIMLAALAEMEGEE